MECSSPRNLVARVGGGKEYLAIFLVGFSIRLLPELLSWPWLIGFDTPEYVANLKDFVVKPNPLTRSVWYGVSRLLPPLLNLLLYPLTFVLDPWYIFKVFPPLLYGLESAAFYSLTDALGMSRRARLISTLIFTFYPVSLRISWDLHRNSLGLLFLILLLAELIRNERPWLIFFLSLGAYLSNEFTFSFAFALVTLSLADDLLKRVPKRRTLPKIMASALGMSVFIVLLLAVGLPVGVHEISLLGLVETKIIPTLMLFIPLIIFLPLGVASFKGDWHIVLLVALITFASFSEMVIPGLFFPLWDRWMYHFVLPLSLYAGAGVSRIRGSEVFVSLFIVLGLLFTIAPYQPTGIAASSDVGALEYRGFSLTPSGMLRILRDMFGSTSMTYTMMHSSVPIDIERYCLNASRYLSDKKFNELLADFNLYGFVHIERRFAVNVTTTLLDVNTVFNRHLEGLYLRGIRELFLLGWKKTATSLNPPYKMNISKVKEFGPIVLYKCSISGD